MSPGWRVQASTMVLARVARHRHQAGGAPDGADRGLMQVDRHQVRVRRVALWPTTNSVWRKGSRLMASCTVTTEAARARAEAVVGREERHVDAVGGHVAGQCVVIPDRRHGMPPGQGTHLDTGRRRQLERRLGIGVDDEAVLTAGAEHLGHQPRDVGVDAADQAVRQVPYVDADAQRPVARGHAGTPRAPARAGAPPTARVPRSAGPARTARRRRHWRRPSLPAATATAGPA